VVTNKPKQGLDAAGFLLLAEGHLVKAREDLRKNWSLSKVSVIGLIGVAITAISISLKLLMQEKEELCKL